MHFERTYLSKHSLEEGGGQLFLFCRIPSFLISVWRGISVPPPIGARRTSTDSPVAPRPLRCFLCIVCISVSPARPGLAGRSRGLWRPFGGISAIRSVSGRGGERREVGCNRDGRTQLQPQSQPQPLPNTTPPPHEIPSNSQSIPPVYLSLLLREY